MLFAASPMLTFIYFQKGRKNNFPKIFSESFRVFFLWGAFLTKTNCWGSCRGDGFGKFFWGFCGGKVSGCLYKGYCINLCNF